MFSQAKRSASDLKSYVKNIKIDGRGVINNTNSPNVVLKIIDIGDCK